MTNKYFVTISIPNKKDKKVTIKTDRLMNAESIVVTEHMQDLPDGSVAVVRHKDDLTRITKDKTKEHWNHNGYAFSG